jgi:ABC-type methionine transport system ATPase subunit
VKNVNGVPYRAQGRIRMHADDITVLYIGQDKDELQITSENIGLVEQHFEVNNLSSSPTKTHYILFQMKQCRQESELNSR